MAPIAHYDNISNLFARLPNYTPTLLRSVIADPQLANDSYSKAIAIARSQTDTPLLVSAAILPFYQGADSDSSRYLLAVPGRSIPYNDYTINNKRVSVIVKGTNEPSDKSILDTALTQWHEETHIDLSTHDRGSLWGAAGMVTQLHGNNVFVFAWRSPRPFDIAGWYCNTFTDGDQQLAEIQTLHWLSYQQCQRLVYKPHLAIITRLHLFNNQPHD